MSHFEQRWGTTYTYTPGRWVADAICATVDPEIFFPDKGQPTALAKLVCRRCPVINECRAYALNAPTRLEGVWGGMSERERRTKRSERGLSNRPATIDMNGCGTAAGAKRHWRNNEPACEPCLRAANAQKARSRA